MTLNIHGLMQELSKSRPIFHSEADFQHALAWLIHEAMPASQIRLEYPFRRDGNTMYLDIWLPTERIAIELKYLARRLELDFDGEHFARRNQSAQDTRRYDFLADMQRLEDLADVKEEPTRAGLAVLLTNDPAYWRSPVSGWELTNDAAFRLHEDRELTGELAWADHAGAGTTRSREAPIRLMGTYMMRWQDYSTFAGEKYGKFRYLAVAFSIGPEGGGGRGLPPPFSRARNARAAARASSAFIAPGLPSVTRCGLPSRR